MPSSAPRKVRRCPASSAGALLSVLAVLVALVVARTSLVPAQAKEESAANTTGQSRIDSSWDGNTVCKCDFVPKWIFPIIDPTRNGSDESLTGIGVRLNTEYFIASLRSIRGGQYQSMNVTLGNMTGLFKMQRPTVVVKWGPWGNKHPIYYMKRLYYMDTPRLPVASVESESSECHLVGWSLEDINRKRILLGKAKVRLLECDGDTCKFKISSPRFSCGFNSLHGAPVICSIGKKDVVTHVYKMNGPRLPGENNCEEEFYALRLNMFTEQISRVTGYKQPNQTFCPIC